MQRHVSTLAPAPVTPGLRPQERAPVYHEEIGHAHLEGRPTNEPVLQCQHPDTSRPWKVGADGSV